MEAMVWLFFEIGGLLALAGIVFFGLGWWAKGSVKSAEQIMVPTPFEPPATRPSLADLAMDAERQQWERQMTELKTERDSLLGEIGQMRSRSEVPAPAPKPVKPRTRKSKK